MKTDCLSRPPFVGATCRGCRRVADVPRLPNAAPWRTPCGRARVPSSPDVATLLWHLSATLGKRLTSLHYVRLLPRYRVWQSASSTPTRAAAGFSWTSPAASEAVAPAAHNLFLAPRFLSWLIRR